MKLQELVPTFTAVERLDIELDRRRAQCRHDVEGFDGAEAAYLRPPTPVLDLASDGLAEEISEVEFVNLAQVAGVLQAEKQARRVLGDGDRACQDAFGELDGNAL